jgi:DNA-binding response OmpR family regulator
MLVVAVTGWGQEEDRRRTAEAGFDAHFTKPVDFASVMALIGQRRSTLQAADTAEARVERKARGNPGRTH